MPNHKNTTADYKSKLLIALEQRHADEIHRLINENPELIYFLDTQGNTLIHYAIRWNHQGLLDFLLEAGCSPLDANHQSEEPLHEVLQNPRAINLLSNLRNAYLKQQKFGHFHPLIMHETTLFADAAAFEEPAKHLFRGEDTFKLYWQDGALYTPIHIAAALGKTDIIELFNKRLPVQGLHLPNKRGQTPLLLAALHGCHETLLYLLGWFLKQQMTHLITSNDNQGNTVLHYLAAQGHENLIKILLDRDKAWYSYCVDLLAKPNQQGHVPLQLAINNGQLAAFACLFEIQQKLAFDEILEEVANLRRNHNTLLTINTYLYSQVASNHPKSLPAYLALADDSSTYQSLDEAIAKAYTPSSRDENNPNEKNNKFDEALETEFVKRVDWTRIKIDAAKTDAYITAMQALSMDCHVIKWQKRYSPKSIYYWAGYYGHFNLLRWLTQHWFAQAENLLNDRLIRRDTDEEMRVYIRNHRNKHYQDLREEFRRGLFDAEFSLRENWDLSTTHFNEEELSLIKPKLLQHVPQMKQLNLSNNQWNDNVIDELFIDLIDKINGLQILDLSNNNLGNGTPSLKSIKLILKKITDWNIATMDLAVPSTKATIEWLLKHQHTLFIMAEFIGEDYEDNGPLKNEWNDHFPQLEQVTPINIQHAEETLYWFQSRCLQWLDWFDSKPKRLEALKAELCSPAVKRLAILCSRHAKILKQLFQLNLSNNNLGELEISYLKDQSHDSIDIIFSHQKSSSSISPRNKFVSTSKQISAKKQQRKAKLKRPNPSASPASASSITIPASLASSEAIKLLSFTSENNFSNSHSPVLKTNSDLENSAEEPLIPADDNLPAIVKFDHYQAEGDMSMDSLFEHQTTTPQTTHLASQIFLGDGSTDNPSCLVFETWYSPRIIKFLLELAPNQAQCLRLVFADASNGEYKQNFKQQLQQLILLTQKLQRPAIFISKEPTPDNNHFVTGLVWDKQLLIVNPLGITDKTACYQTLAELKTEGNLEIIGLSNNRLQKHLFEEQGLVSCGPIAAELAIHILMNYTQDKLINYLTQLDTNETNQDETTGLIFHSISINPLLANTLMSLEKFEEDIDADNYCNQINLIRRKQFELLEKLPVQLAQKNFIAIEEFLKECENSAIQTVFDALITQNKTIDTVSELPAYQRLIQELYQPALPLIIWPDENRFIINQPIKTQSTPTTSTAHKRYRFKPKNRAKPPSDAFNESVPLLDTTLVNILKHYKNPPQINRLTRFWLNTPLLQALLLKLGSLSSCCDAKKTQPHELSPEELNDKLIFAAQNPFKKLNSEQQALNEISSFHSGYLSPAIDEAMQAPFSYKADSKVRAIAHFLEGFSDHTMWTLEKGWLMVVSAFIYRELNNFIHLPAWQQQRANLFNILSGKTAEEQLAANLANAFLGDFSRSVMLPTLTAWIGSSLAFGMVGGGIQAWRQRRALSVSDLEQTKHHVLYHSANPVAVVTHFVLELLEIPIVTLLLSAAPMPIAGLLLFKLFHLFHQNTSDQLRYAILWDTSLTIEQRAIQFEALMRACNNRHLFSQMEALTVLTDIVYHISLKQLDKMNSEDEERVALEDMKKRGLALLHALSQSPTAHHQQHTLRYLHALYLNWTLGLEKNPRRWLAMAALIYPATRLPRLVTLGLFLRTIFEGIIEFNERRHAEHECHERHEGHWLWAYIPSLGEYRCSPCPDIPMAPRYMIDNDLCIQGFLNDSRPMEQWDIMLHRLNFTNISSLDLSPQSGILERGQLPELLQKISKAMPSVDELLLYNKPDAPYGLAADGLLAIANFTKQYSDFFRLSLYAHRFDSFSSNNITDFAATLNRNLSILILDDVRLGFTNTSGFFANLPSNLFGLNLGNNYLNDTAGEAFAQNFYRFINLAGVFFNGNKNITDKSILPIAQQWHLHPNFRAWSLSGTAINDATVIELANQTRFINSQNELILDIEECAQITDQAGIVLAQNLLSNHSFVNYFAVDNPKFTEVTLRAFTVAIPQAKYLKAFGVNANNSTSGAIVDYLIAFKSRPELEILDLSDLPLSYSVVAQLSEIIPMLPNLKLLSMDNTGLIDSSFDLLLPALRESAINGLSLSGNPLLTIKSLEGLLNDAPRNLNQLDLSKSNLTSNSAEILGKLIHQRPINILGLSGNSLLGSSFAKVFANYLPDSSVNNLNLASCGLEDEGALNIGEVLTSIRVPDDWLDRLDTATLHALAKGEPGTNITWLNLANNNLTDISGQRLCQLLPGTGISVNTLFLDGNPGINEVTLKACGDLGLVSAGSSLTPTGPYAWLGRQLSLLRQLHFTKTGIAVGTNPATANNLAATSHQFLTAAGQAAGLAAISSITAYVLNQAGLSKNTAQTWGVRLQQSIAFGLTLWRSPTQACLMLFTSSMLYRLTPDQQTAQFLEIMLNVCLLSFQGALGNISRLEMLALQLMVSMAGALTGQLAVYYTANHLNSKSSYSFWQADKTRGENNITAFGQETLKPEITKKATETIKPHI